MLYQCLCTVKFKYFEKKICGINKESSNLSFIRSTPAKTIMKRTLRNILSVAAFFPLVVLAQQDPSYTHFTFNKVLLNPAYAGASGNFCLNAITHQQWRGYEDQTSTYQTQGGLPVSDNFAKNIAPKTSGFAFSAPINVTKDGVMKNYGGAYLGFVNDVVAYETNTYLRGGIAGAYTLTDGSSIRLGFDFVSLTKELDGTKLRAHQPNDPRIPNDKSGDTRSTFGAGLYYSNPNINNLYVGLSSSHIAEQSFAYGPSGAITIETARHYYAMAGMRFENFLANPALTLDPAVFLKTVNAKGGFVKPELDLQGMVTYNNTFAGGLNIRSYGVGMDAVSLMLGYYPPIKGNSPGPNGTQLLRIGYSYDITVSQINQYSRGTHEIQVNYCFKISIPEKPEKVYRHPRYMQRPVDIE